MHQSGKKWFIRGGEILFFGHNRHVIDPKGRIILPAKYRDELGDKFFITRGLDPCLLVYPEAEWKKFEDKIRALPLSTGAKIQRFFFSYTDETSCDKQGRVLVSDFLKKYAGLQKDIVISGVGNRLEIWDAATYDEDIEGVSDDADIIAAQMEILGI